jgi:ribosome-binding factor A
VGERITRDVSELLLKKLNDPRVGFVTVTGAKVADDLRNATIYVSVFGDAKKKKTTMQGLEAALPWIQREVFKGLQIKVPTLLRFELDETLDKAVKVEKLLKEVAEERQAREGADAGAEGGDDEAPR